MQPKILNGIGYWRNVEDNTTLAFPHPTSLVRSNWIPQDHKSRLLHYLRSAPRIRNFWGHSYCRFSCGVSHEEMGSLESSDGVWLWPEGLAHYVECHDVCLPDDFVEHALLSLSSTIDDKSFSGKVDWSYWIEWTRKIC